MTASSAPQKELQRAVTLFQEGRLALAEEICAELSARFPLDVQLAHFGGVLANRMGRFDVAVERLGRCLRLDPGLARAHAALAFAQEQSGRLDEAGQSFAAAVRAEPRFAEAHNGLGIVFFKQARFAEALACFDRAAAIQPPMALAHLNAARALQQMGRTEAAARRYRIAGELAGADAALERECALGLLQCGEVMDAIAAMTRFLEKNPGDASLRGELAAALETAGRSAEARLQVERARRDRPDAADVLALQGRMQAKGGDSEAAAASLERALSLDPALAHLNIDLATVYRRLGREGDASSAMERARGSNALGALALAQLGTMYSDQGSDAEAEESLRAAIAMNALLPEPHGMWATHLLRSGDFARGWREYLYRPTRGSEIFAAVAAGGYPPVLREDVRGRDIVLLAEQGLGDILFFLRYAAPLAQGGARLHVRADRRLEPIVRRALPIATWLDADEYPADSIVVWMGDLPAIVRPLAGGDILPSLRFEPLPERVRAMRERLDKLPAPRVGLAWRAGTAAAGPGPLGQSLLSKQIDPGLLGRALARSGASYVSIQRNAEPRALESLAEGLGAPVHDFSAANEDLEEMLALLSLLDGYVGVSSTNVHLIAAVGGRAEILVPHPAEWRWQGRGSRSPWFPGFEIHRQDRSGDWTAALAGLRGGRP